MLEERRYNERKLMNAPVRLYHPEFGRVDGISHDISDGGIAISLNSFKLLDIDSSESPLLLRPINTDVLFPVRCLRQSELKLVVKFLE